MSLDDVSRGDVDTAAAIIIVINARLLLGKIHSF